MDSTLDQIFNTLSAIIALIFLTGVVWWTLSQIPTRNDPNRGESRGTTTTPPSPSPQAAGDRTHTENKGWWAAIFIGGLLVIGFGILGIASFGGLIIPSGVVMMVYSGYRILVKPREIKMNGRAQH
jgi:hypothetical protein